MKTKKLQSLVNCFKWHHQYATVETVQMDLFRDSDDGNVCNVSLSRLNNYILVGVLYIEDFSSFQITL